ncbi:uncharacterized protein LOC113327548 [Papaver somniferum]|uniref:uncharacterized protein LOC113327548 n=1 Tax=Papaver somniferum TaxID=3469 RepID=UPI000E6FDA4A|nr:uncharacterized protein LOC113327548 [Papaver somniferum]
MLVRHFDNQYNAGPITIDLNLFNNFLPRISSNRCMELMRPPSNEEIHKALLSIGSEKAPGPDGYTSKFFKEYWDLTNPQIFELVHNFFENVELYAPFNHTTITLIPKNDAPSNPNEFRPIGLCNVVYKIISKLLADRLRPILQFMIIPYQSAFVPNRAIHDNIDIATELFHHIRQSASTNNPKIALKLDIKKAYDSLDWGFIRLSLKALGFPPKFIDHIMVCITTVNYSVNVNESLHGKIIPKRGLRQGDPLSLYIFILCAEILSTNLARLEEEGKMKRLKISNNNLPILHLMYADDLLITCAADTETCNNLNSILHSYTTSAGQLINTQKSVLIHHPHLNTNSLERLKNSFNIPTTPNPPKYLGICFKEGRNSSQIFAQLLQRMERKAKGWISKCVNQAGRRMLINTSLIPTANHVMQTRLLPVHVHQKMDKIARNFFWGHESDTRKLHVLGREKLNLPIGKGRLGIRNTRKHNFALLGKRVWQIHSEPNTICNRMFRDKYLQHQSIIRPMQKPPDSTSASWKNIHKVADFVQRNTAVRLGDGNSTTIKENWIPGITNVNIPTTVENDLRILQTLKANFPQKIRLFLWKVIHHGLTTFESLHRRNITSTATCPICNQHRESTQHCLSECNEAIQVWNLLGEHINRGYSSQNPYNGLRLPPHPAPNIIFQHTFGKQQAVHRHQINTATRTSIRTNVPFNPPRNFNEFIKKAETKTEFTICCYTIWNIWLARNDRGYNNKVQSLRQTLQISLLLSQEFEWATKHKLHQVTEAAQQQTNRRNDRPSNIVWVKWTPPPPNWMKVNTDGASKGETDGAPKFAGAGWICRNPQGKVVMAMATPLGIANALVVETWAFLLATRTSVQKNWVQIHFEADSKTLVSLINGKEATTTPWIIHTMIKEIQSHLQQIGSYTITHIYREMNQAADGWANLANQQQIQFLFWEEEENDLTMCSTRRNKIHLWFLDAFNYAIAIKMDLLNLISKEWEAERGQGITYM